MRDYWLIVSDSKREFYIDDKCIGTLGHDTNGLYWRTQGTQDRTYIFPAMSLPTIDDWERAMKHVEDPIRPMLLEKWKRDRVSFGTTPHPLPARSENCE
jgi:hypothetical protein